MEPDATDDELKRAYRKAAMRWHPDRNPDDPSAEERFKAIGAAWETLGDPARRAEHDGKAGRTRAGQLPESFLDDVADAVERAQNWVELAVLPHYLRTSRGQGTEALTQLVRDLPDLSNTSTFRTQTSWLGRRRAKDVVCNIHVELDMWPSRDLSTLAMGMGRGWILRISPGALWMAGFREAGEIDMAVMRVMLARYAQILTMGRRLPLPPNPDEAAWVAALEVARAADDAAVQSRLMWACVYALFAAFICALLYSGYTA